MTLLEDVDAHLELMMSFIGDPETEDSTRLPELLAELHNHIKSGGPLPRCWAKPVPDSLHNVLMDCTYANDCCVRAVAELSLDKHMQDAEVWCTHCRTNFRYTETRDGKLAWQWRLPESGRPHRGELIFTVGELLAGLNRSGLESEEDDGTESPA